MGFTANLSKTAPAANNTAKALAALRPAVWEDHPDQIFGKGEVKDLGLTLNDWKEAAQPLTREQAQAILNERPATQAAFRPTTLNTKTPQQQARLDTAKAIVNEIMPYVVLPVDTQVSKKSCKELAVYIKENGTEDQDELNAVLISMLKKINQTQRAVDGLMQLNLQQAEMIQKLSSQLKKQSDDDFSTYDSASS
jgi:hypothetical protein